VCGHPERRKVRIRGPKLRGGERSKGLAVFLKRHGECGDSA
jgi:hypothetical protein